MADMYEIIFENPVYDIVIVGDFGNIRNAMIDRVPASGTHATYSNHYNKNYEKVQEEIDEIMSDLGIN